MNHVTKFSPGDNVYFIDKTTLAPTGPAEITEVAIHATKEEFAAVVYKFGNSCDRRESEVFDTHAEALEAAMGLRYKSKGIAAPRTTREFHGLPQTATERLITRGRDGLLEDEDPKLLDGGKRR